MAIMLKILINITEFHRKNLAVFQTRYRQEAINTVTCTAWKTNKISILIRKTLQQYESHVNMARNYKSIWLQWDPSVYIHCMRLVIEAVTIAGESSKRCQQMPLSLYYLPFRGNHMHTPKMFELHYTYASPLEDNG